MRLAEPARRELVFEVAADPETSLALPEDARLVVPEGRRVGGPDALVAPAVGQLLARGVVVVVIADLSVAVVGGVEHVDDAVQCIGTVESISRTTNDFNRTSLLRIDFEQCIRVAESGRPGRDAVFQKQKRAAGTGAGQDRRSNRR